MILAVDVHYPGRGAIVAGILFEDWPSGEASGTCLTRVSEVADYVPGAFYRRELPCLLALLHEHALAPDCIVVDGHVVLGADARPGLGRHLFDALEGRVPVIGVAKTRFAGMSADCDVLRGDSARPLHVTAAGLSQEEAKACIRAMHGAHRLPTLLKAVDRLCRHPD